MTERQAGRAALEEGLVGKGDPDAAASRRRPESHPQCVSARRRGSIAARRRRAEARPPSASRATAR